MGSVGMNEGVSANDYDGGDADTAVLYREHAPELRRLARAITFDVSLAEEVVQDAFVGLLRLGRDVNNPPAYLHRSVVNGAVDRVRRRERFRLLPDRRAPDVGEAEVDELWPLIARLPPRQRALIALRFYEDQTYEQIGETLEIPPGSVKSGLHRALKKLKEQL